MKDRHEFFSLRMLALLAVVLFPSLWAYAQFAKDPQRDLSVTFSSRYEGQDPGSVRGLVRNNSSNGYPCVRIEFDLSTRFDLRPPGQTGRHLGVFPVEVENVQPHGVREYQQRLPFPAGIGLKSVSECPFPQAKHPQEQLRNIAQQAINTNSVAVMEPTFRVSEGKLAYSFGSVHKVGVPSSMPSPLDIPLNAQLRIELLRKHYFQPGIREFWKPHLERAEQVISKMLAYIEESPGASGLILLARLKSDEATIDAILRNAVSDYASQHNLILSPVGISLKVRPYKVDLITSPPDGKIWLALEIDALIGEMFKKDLDKDVLKVMTQVVGVPLLGAYRYKVEWEQQRLPVRGTTVIQNDDPVVLK